jgi:hypothetical protein
MSRGEQARDEIRDLGEQADAVAQEYGTLDADQRRQLFDELAGIVDTNVALEREAVTQLGRAARATARG